MSYHRNRSEAVWTDEAAKVRGKRNRNRAWVLFALIIAAAAIVTLTWTRFMNIQDVTYELRTCQQPLTKDATWEEVQAAACDPAPIGDTRAILMAGVDEQEPDSTSESSWVFEEVPVTSPETGIRVLLTEPATTVVLAEPDNETIRRELRSDASGTDWSANVGGRGPTTYWLLVTPATP